MNCSSKKIGHQSESLALEALLEHRARFNHRENSGPINVYRCSLCDQWHFTSQGEPHKALKDEARKTNLLREAFDWERKLR